VNDNSSDNSTSLATNVVPAYSANGDAPVEIKSGESYNAGWDTFGPSEPGALLQSAHTAARQPIQSRTVTASDYVRLPDGDSTPVAVAASLGLIERKPDGTFADLPAEVFAERWEALKEGKAPKEPGAEEAAPIEALDDKAEALLTEAFHNPSADQAALFGAASAITAGADIPEATINRIASSLGKEPSEVAEAVAHVHEQFADQAARSLAPLIGLDGYADLWAWAESACPDEIRAAAMRHFNEGNTRAYRPIAERYVRETMRGRNNALLKELAAENPEMNPKWVGDQLVVQHPKYGEVALADAITRGWIKRA
jgi:hypothetical protein